MAIATGQITIIDYNDALTLTGYIQSNHPKTQMYNPDNGTYQPNWASSNLVLTPSLFKLGTATDIITDAAVQSVQWYDVTTGSEVAITANATHVFSGTKNHILTIKANTLAGLPGKDYMCKVTYKDPSTGLDLIHKFDISFSRVVNGSGITDAVLTALDGAVFKNGSVSSLRLKAELWRGSTIDTTSVTYTWYIMDSSVSTDQGGGIGWRKITADAANVITGYNLDTLTVYPAAFNNIGVFKVYIKDTDAASPTNGTSFIDTITLADQSDPIQVSITSTGGDVFKNGLGSTTLTAKLFQAGSEIDAGGTKTYRWYKYNSAGTLVTGWGGATDYKTGKSITVGDSDVDTKATFLVEVS
ncbi:hypothetical protein [Proteiniclasticum sp. QWL-01]|uniref:hypothetical protein n=1 Tax=Proteiniclasticum sp. QWL-01 TaxID=3036945 RepID=UPI0024103FAF|nr:hypothetical protein [Proteiniclasticum sp. QWL-01]WFF71997.1 hypothetical protein P6M73_11890 [Proteiniclasticum sp. QWL-01]